MRSTCRRMQQHSRVLCGEVWRFLRCGPKAHAELNRSRTNTVLRITVLAMYTKLRAKFPSLPLRSRKDEGITPHFLLVRVALRAIFLGMNDITFALRGDYIPLDALLKATGLAPSGGLAKAWVAQGLVCVDGALELRKTCKIRSGQVVTLAQTRVHVLAPATDMESGAHERAHGKITHLLLKSLA